MVIPPISTFPSPVGSPWLDCLILLVYVARKFSNIEQQTSANGTLLRRIYIFTAFFILTDGRSVVHKIYSLRREAG